MTEQLIEITTYIASTPENVWRALTDPDITERYWGGTRIESDWLPGSKVLYRRGGEIVDEHDLLVSDPPFHFIHTFHPLFGEFAKESPSRVSIEIAGGGGVVRLTLTHDCFPPNSAVYRACSGAWPMLISSLKSLLETGSPLPPFTADHE